MMPNGPGYTENEWSSWRGKTSAQLEQALAWMKNHEAQEFSHHARVEAHIVTTQEWIARSSQHREELAHRVEELENTVGLVVKDAEQLKTRMNVLFTTLLPIAGWAVWQVVDHFRAH